MPKRKSAEGTQRHQFTAAQIKVILKAVKSTDRAGVFNARQSREGKIIVAKLTQ